MAGGNGWLAALVIGAVAGIGCGGASEFRCSDDLDCVQGEDVGLCQPTGHCSYVDESCPSGFRYPEGAPTDIAGLCAGEGRTTDAGSTGSSSAGSSSGTETETETATGSGTASTEGTTDATSATQGDASTGATATTAAETSNVCMQEDGEPNDKFESATPLTSGCPTTILGLLDGDDVQDYFSIEAADCLADSVSLFVDGPTFAHCLEFECLDGGEPVAECSGAVAVNSSLYQCCVPEGDVVLNPLCASGPPQTIYVRVAAEEPVCVMYTATVQ